MTHNEHEGGYYLVTANPAEYPGAPWPLLTECQVSNAEDRWQAALDQLLKAGREETER